MKKIFMFIALVAMVTGLSANDAKTLSGSQKMLGGSVGDKIIYLYQNSSLIDTSNKILKLVAKKQLCSKPAVRNIINNGVEVEYLYLSKSRDKMTVVIVDSCK